MKRLLLVLKLFVASSTLLLAGRPNAPARTQDYFDNFTLKNFAVNNASPPVYLDVTSSRSVEADTQETDPKLKGFGYRPLDPSINKVFISYQEADVSLTTVLTELARKAKLDAYLTSEGLIFTEIGDPPIGTRDDFQIWSTLFRHEPQQK